MRRSVAIALLAAAALAGCGQKQPEVIIDTPPAGGGGSSEGGAFGGGAGGPGGATQTAAATPPTQAEVKAAAADPNRPHRKAGLWQLAATNGEQSADSTLCVDDASEVRVNAFDTRRLLPGGGRGGPGGGGQRGQGGGGFGGQRAGGGGQGGGEGGGQGGGQRAGGGGFGGGQRGGASPCPPPRIAKAGAGWTATSTCKREFGDNSMTIATHDTLTGDLQAKYTLKATRTVSGAPRPEMNRSTTTTVNASYKGPCPAGQKGGDLTAEGRTVNLMAGRGPGGGQGGG